MAVIKVKGLQSLAEDMPLRMDDPYEILNKSFWVGTVRADGLHEQMLARNKFLRAVGNSITCMDTERSGSCGKGC